MIDDVTVLIRDVEMLLAGGSCTRVLCKFDAFSFIEMMLEPRGKYGILVEFARYDAFLKTDKYKLTVTRRI